MGGEGVEEEAEEGVVGELKFNYVTVYTVHFLLASCSSTLEGTALTELTNRRANFAALLLMTKVCSFQGHTSFIYLF